MEPLTILGHWCSHGYRAPNKSYGVKIVKTGAEILKSGAGYIVVLVERKPFLHSDALSQILRFSSAPRRHLCTSFRLNFMPRVFAMHGARPLWRFWTCSCHTFKTQGMIWVEMGTIHMHSTYFKRYIKWCLKRRFWRNLWRNLGRNLWRNLSRNIAVELEIWNNCWKRLRLRGTFIEQHNSLPEIALVLCSETSLLYHHHR